MRRLVRHARTTGTVAPPGCRAGTAILTVLLALLAAGCMVGPDYRSPPPPTAEHWLQADDPRVRTEPADVARWWAVFHDPVLDRLVELAYRQNPSLEAAALRIVQAQARRGIAVGSLYPQSQALSGAYARGVRSLNAPTAGSAAAATAAGAAAGITRGFDLWDVGFATAWEVDLWGRFRRDIEAADAELLASVADWEDVLTSLVGQVATRYVQTRVLEERLQIATDNAETQREGLRIARIRFEAGGTSELDVQQATSLLRDTEATVPQLEAALRAVADALSVLLGMPPQELGDLLGQPGRIPTPPPTVVVGIPAELIHRRPDVRRAERAAAAQSARIGVAFADLFPRVELVGRVGLGADDAAKFLEGRAFTGNVGPRVDWPVLSYGRIVNNVRLQDAAFQELLAVWRATVLRAQQEVEDSLAGYLRGLEAVARLTESVAAADRAVEIAMIQYREGAADFTRVLNSQQAKLREDDQLADNRGRVATSVVSLYEALGGGWDVATGTDLLPADTRRAMRERTWYGGLLDEERPARDVEDAADGTERGGGRRWRAWWPTW